MHFFHRILKFNSLLLTVTSVSSTLTPPQGESWSCDQTKGPRPQSQRTHQLGIRKQRVKQQQKQHLKPGPGSSRVQPLLCTVHLAKVTSRETKTTPVSCPDPANVPMVGNKGEDRVLKFGPQAHPRLHGPTAAGFSPASGALGLS